jgi:hypothetical protein
MSDEKAGHGKSKKQSQFQPFNKTGPISRNELVSIQRKQFRSMPASENTNPNGSALLRPTWKPLLEPRMQQAETASGQSTIKATDSVRQIT